MITTPARPETALRERFLADLLELCFSRGWRTHGEFVAAFPPAVLMSALAGDTERRTRLLVEGARIPAKIAVRHSATAAREDLEIALDEGITSATQIVEILGAKGAARCLDGADLWGFASGGDWLARHRQSPAATSLAQERISAIVDLAATLGLLDKRALLASQSPVQLAARLGATQLRRAFALAWRSAEQQKPVELAELLAATELEAASGDLDPSSVWQSVIVSKVVGPLGLTTRSDPGTVTLTNGASPTRGTHSVVSSGRSPSATPPPGGAQRSPSATPLPGTPRKARLPSLVEEISDDDLEPAEETAPGTKAARQVVAPPRPAAPRPAPPEAASAQKTSADPRGREAERRRTIVAELEALDRVPRNFEYLGTAILRGIARMYAELKNHRGKAARIQCARQSFDNDSHLRTAMLALLDLLEPELASSSADAPVDQLVEALMNAEKALWQRSKGQRRSLPPEEPLPPKRAVHVEAHVPPPARRR